MTESIYIHLQCFWYDTAFNTSTVFSKKILFCQTETNSPRQKNTAKAQFCYFSASNEKTEKVQKWAGKVIVSENHILPAESIRMIGI